ncbi:Dabb family protein [Verrucomicrobiales bacterium]|nr:Dabb family protein [Verrucomicrobiales bacterium]
MMKTLAFTSLVLFLALMPASAGELKHVVLFKFKESAPATAVADAEKAFAALKEKIETIVGFEGGKNVSPEDRAKGFTHLYVITFEDQKGLDVYAPHPAHEAFKARMKPILEEALIFDYVTE